jgi:hypothetical protein
METPAQIDFQGIEPSESVRLICLPDQRRSAAVGSTPDAVGINLLPALSEASVTAVARQVAEVRRPGDIVIVSIHWGPNWGYEVPEDQRWFAPRADRPGRYLGRPRTLFAPSKAVGVYRNRLILYGCGDFLNDYEGIRGYEEFRDDLAVMYLATVDSTTSTHAALEMVPFQAVPAGTPVTGGRRLAAANAGPRKPAIWHDRRADSGRTSGGVSGGCPGWHILLTLSAPDRHRGRDQYRRNRACRTWLAARR